MRALTLYIPGLLEMSPALTEPAPLSPALLTLLARARRENAIAGDYDKSLLQLFGAAVADEVDAPIAALSRLGETEVGALDGYWLRCDPVHLRPDQARVLLFGPDVLSVRMDEARSLAAAFNAEYGAEGWQLETPHPARWYLRLPDDPAINTHPLHAVIGRNIDSFLPQGAGARRWRGVLNDVQMLFHGSPVNAAREQQGQLAINSMWFWGGGRLPKIKAQAWSQVCSEDPCARGLAMAAGVAVVNAAEIAVVWQQQGGSVAQLVALTDMHEAVSYGDQSAWCKALSNLERTWCAPALAALRSGSIDVLRLYPGNDSVYVVTRADLRRFWRRRRALDGYRSTD